MWPFRKRVDRKDVVEAILSLEKQLSDKENRLDVIESDRQDVFKQGKSEKDKQKQLFLAKKIAFLDQEKRGLIHEMMMIMYNINLSNKLKQAIDSDQFINGVAASKINKLLGNQQKLGTFLNKAMNRKIKVEEMMTNADSLFGEVQAAYVPNKEIYGINESDDELLAIFEQDELSDIQSSQHQHQESAETIKKVGE
jgi:hypothetical protein